MINSPTKIVALVLILIVLTALPEYSLSSRRSYPHHVKITNTIESDFFKISFMCSGSIIADIWILTIAKCCKGSLKVYYDSDFYDSGRNLEVQEIRKRNESNLALIKTDKMVFSESAKAIALPKRAYRSKSLEHTRCIFTGWEKGGDISKGLAMGDVTLGNQNVCEAQFQTSLCGAFSLGSDQVVNYGSPLVYDSADGRMLIGVYERSAYGTAYFVSLLESFNVEWIKNVTGLFTDL